MAAARAEEEGQDEYLLALESSDMANLCADVASLGFLGGEGITPGRLLRVAHALTRVTLLTIAGATASCASICKPTIHGVCYCCSAQEEPQYITQNIWECEAAPVVS